MPIRAVKICGTAGQVSWISAPLLTLPRSVLLSRKFFYRELLAKRAFAEVVLIPETYTTRDEALRLAKRHQADVMLLGEIPYYLTAALWEPPACRSI